MNGSLAFPQDNERQALAEYVGRLLAAYDTLLNTYIVTADRWDQNQPWSDSPVAPFSPDGCGCPRCASQPRQRSG